MENFKDYMLAGKAIFTVESTKIDKRFTYKVKKSGQYYKVSFMYEPDKYRHMCLLYASHDLLTPVNVKCGMEDIRFKMFNKFCTILNSGDWPDTCKVYKSIYCARCGRRLTTPESIKYGLGPNCRKYLWLALMNIHIQRTNVQTSNSRDQRNARAIGKSYEEFEEV